MRFVLSNGSTPLATSLTRSDILCWARNECNVSLYGWMQDGPDKWKQGPLTITRVPSVFSDDTRTLMDELQEERERNRNLKNQLSKATALLSRKRMLLQPHLSRGELKLMEELLDTNT